MSGPAEHDRREAIRLPDRASDEEQAEFARGLAILQALADMLPPLSGDRPLPIPVVQDDDP